MPLKPDPADSAGAPALPAAEQARRLGVALDAVAAALDRAGAGADLQKELVGPLRALQAAAKGE